MFYGFEKSIKGGGGCLVNIFLTKKQTHFKHSQPSSVSQALNPTPKMNTTTFVVVAALISAALANPVQDKFDGLLGLLSGSPSM